MHQQSIQLPENTWAIAVTMFHYDPCTLAQGAWLKTSAPIKMYSIDFSSGWYYKLNWSFRPPVTFSGAVGLK